MCFFFQVQLDSLPAFGLSPRSTAWSKWIKWNQSQMRLNSSPPNVRSQREGPERCLTYSVATATLLYTNNSDSTNSIYFAVYVCVCISSAYSIWRNRHICFFSGNGIQQTYTLAIAFRSSNYDFELVLVNMTYLSFLLTLKWKGNAETNTEKTSSSYWIL